MNGIRGAILLEHRALADGILDVSGGIAVKVIQHENTARGVLQAGSINLRAAGGIGRGRTLHGGCRAAGKVHAVYKYEPQVSPPVVVKLATHDLHARIRAA